MTWALFRFALLKKIKKRKIIITLNNNWEYIKFFKKIINIKPANLYTKRGLRLAQCLLQKRFSKKSSLK
jgi:hypothetical protein